MYPRTSTLWYQQSDADSFPTLDRELEADVVVIGAGITGVTAALQLARAGKRVVVLEGRTLCSGATAGSTGHVTEVIDPGYRRITDVFGADAARLVAESSRAAIAHIANNIETLGIACDWQRVPGYLYSEDPADRDALDSEHQAARNAGLAATFDVGPGLSFSVAASVRFEQQARFHPRAYVCALARAALAAGAQFFERSRVVDIKDGEPVELRTENGVRVRASAVFCAAHSPLNRVFLQTKLAHYQSYAVAFHGHPIEDALFWDRAHPYHYLRTATLSGARYFILGGEDHKVGAEEHTQLPFERLLLYARARFGTDRPAFHWSAQVIESVDGLPFIGTNSASEHVYVATGFSGNGMTYGTLAALLVSDSILGVESSWADLYDATRIKPAAVPAFVRESVEMPVHLIGARLEPPDVRSTRQIERDQGRRMKVGGKRLAVYRDARGGLHAVSGVCTHLGCVVRFNEAERSWDCPCHGSRYSIDGAVLDGPALTPLAKYPLEEDREQVFEPSQA